MNIKRLSVKALRWTAGILLGLVGLVVLLIVALYIPPVQQWVAKVALEKVNSSMKDMRIELDRFRLRFPLNVELKGVRIIEADGDTMVNAAMLLTRVNPLELLRGRVDAPVIDARSLAYRMNGPDSAMFITAAIEAARIDDASFALDMSALDVAAISIDSAAVRLAMRNDTAAVKPDTASAPLKMRIRVGQARLNHVRYVMTMEGLIDSLGADIPRGRLAMAEVDLGRQTVHARSLTVDSLTAAYIYPAPSQQPTAAKPVTEADTVPYTPWTVTADTVGLTARRALYALSGAKPLKGLDMNYLECSDVAIGVDSFLNRGMELRVPLRRLSARERSGLQLDAKGLFTIDSTAMRATDFDIATGFSRLHLNAMMGMGSLVDDPSLPLAIDAEGNIGLKDAALAFPAMAATVAALPAPSEVKLTARAKGNAGSLRLDKLSAIYPGLLSLQADGAVDNPFNADKLAGKINIDGILTHANPLLHGKGAEALIGARLDPSIAIPERLTLKGSVAYSPGPAAKGAFTLAVPSTGSLAADGQWLARSESFDAKVKLNSFPVDAFMPRIGVGRVSGSLAAKGHGYNPLAPGAELAVKADVTSVEYNKMVLRDLQLEANASNGRLDGWLNSDNEAAMLAADFKAAQTDTGYTWDVTADIDRLDIRALGFSADTLTAAGSLTTTGLFNPRSQALNARLDANALDLTVGSKNISTPTLDLDMRADSTSFAASLLNGDLNATLSGSESLQAAMAKLSRFGPTVTRMLDERNINIDTLSAALPNMAVTLDAGNNNVAYAFLASPDMAMKHAALTFTNDSLLRLSARVTGLRSGTVAIDSLTASAVQHGPFLIYGINADNKPGTLDEFAHIEVKGYIGANKVNVRAIQQNIKKEIGFNIGLNAALAADSTLTLNLTPTNPRIAYHDWKLNSDNFLSYNFRTHLINANLALEGAGSHLSITTREPSDASRKNNDILLAISNLRLQDWLSISPFAPPIEGNLSANLSVNLGRDILGNGTVGLDSLYYDHKRVGNFDANVDVFNDPLTGALRAKADLDVDNQPALSLRGALNDSTARSPIDLNLQILRLPLNAANPFLPIGTASLSGDLTGSLDVTGSMAKPVFNGWVSFDSAAVDVTMAGTRLTLPATRIPVDSGIVRFNNFDILACNDNPLAVNGTVDMRSMVNPAIDISMKANDMQLINSQRLKRGADIFGKAWIDLDASARGNMRFLKVDANAVVRGGSNITYVMAGGTQQLQSVAAGNSDMVHFVSFNDSAAVAAVDSVKPSLAMLLNANLEIRQGSTVSVYLSPDGKNRAELEPYANLNFMMSPISSGRLTGRVTFDDGYVRYTPPLMSEKYFTIEPGSFVSFNGDMLNPILDIHAVDRVKANVTQTGENSRLVYFDVGLDVTNSLQNMHISFDLSTTDDIAVQNELDGMSPDQRANQAMNLLLYGVYTGAGTKGNANIGGNAIFAFLGSKINSWASEVIPWVDISFGMNQYERTYDGSTSTTTSYSYQVSKSLFDNRFKIVVGGNFSADAQADENFSQNIISNISFEYLLNRNGTMYVRLFRHTGYESILEGEITKTGVGFVMKRKLGSLRDFFGRRRRKRAAAAADNAVPADSIAPESTVNPATKP